MSEDNYGTGRTFDAMSARGLAGKRDYVRSLEQRRDEEALSLLVECLCDESWYLRELAENALLRLGMHAGEALLPLLEQGLWFSRVSAARGVTFAATVVEVVDVVEDVVVGWLAAVIGCQTGSSSPPVVSRRTRVPPSEVV